MDLYELIAFFLIYSFVGWVTEVVYQAVAKGNITNRGFLNGPVCPVYGFGVVAVLAIYYAVGRDNIAIIFLEGIILTTLIELIAGWALDKLFHARWWDYSDMPHNLNGYICPAFSIIWGLAVVFVLRIAHPAIAHFTVDAIPYKLGLLLISLFGIALLADTIVTALTLIGLNKKLAELDDLSRAMRSMSDRMSDSIGSNSLKTAQAIGNSRLQYTLAKAELKDTAAELKAAAEQAGQERREELGERLVELNKHYEQIIEKITTSGSRFFGAGRIIKAFPQANHELYKERLKDLQNRLLHPDR